MDTFETGGTAYRVRDMDPKVQMLVLKRLMRFVPALTGSDALLGRIKRGERVEPEDVLGTLAALGPLLADVPDADVDFVVNACLDVTYQQAEGKWHRVRNPDSGVVANTDNLALPRTFGIVANVLRLVFAPLLAEVAPTIAEVTTAQP